MLEGHHGAVNAVAFSPDDATLATASNNDSVRETSSARCADDDLDEGHARDRYGAGGDAEQQFRKIIGYSDLAQLATAVERDLAANRPNTSTPPAAEPAGTLVTA